MGHRRVPSSGMPLRPGQPVRCRRHRRAAPRSGDRQVSALPQKTETEAMEPDYPILEYDDTPEALIEPQRVIRPKDVPEHAVVCFFHDVIEGLYQQHGACIVHPMRSEMGLHPVYELKVEGKRL